jgi:hypothetical protein
MTPTYSRTFPILVALLVAVATWATFIYTGVPRTVGSPVVVAVAVGVAVLMHGRTRGQAEGSATGLDSMGAKPRT